jgi:hypothetical protein
MLVTSDREGPGLNLDRDTDSTGCVLEFPRGSSQNITSYLASCVSNDQEGGVERRELLRRKNHVLWIPGNQILMRFIHGNCTDEYCGPITGTVTPQSPL